MKKKSTNKLKLLQITKTADTFSVVKHKRVNTLVWSNGLVERFEPNSLQKVTNNLNVF